MLAAVLWTTAALVAVATLLFARVDRPGGPIAPAKQFWLAWAVYAWFVLAPTLALATAFTPPVRLVLGVFSAFMALRGAAELVMLFVTKNWRPTYGIAHDVACVALLLLGTAWAATQGVPRSGLAAWGLPTLAVLTVSLGLETYYAARFGALVEGRTTGEDGVWFAPPDDPRFARLNRVTAWANVPLVAFVLALLLAVAGSAR